MAIDLTARWQRTGLYYSLEDAWGTAETTGFYRIRESSQSIPWSAKPIIAPGAPMGSGEPSPYSADFFQGRPGASFQTTHPVTSRAWGDLFTLFFQGIGHLETTEKWASTHTAAGVVAWLPEVTKYATVAVKNDAGTADSSTFRATSCFITQLDLSMPQNTPGENGGLMELTASWVGQTSARGNLSVGTATLDTGAAYYTGQTVFSVGADMDPVVEGRILSANLSFKNGGALDPTGAATGLSPAGTMGMMDLTGSVTMYWGQGAHEAANPNATEGLLDALDANTYKYAFWRIATVGTDDMEIGWPILITGTPSFGETNGIQTATFNFTGVRTATAADIPKVHVPTGGIFESGTWA